MIRTLFETFPWLLAALVVGFLLGSSYGRLRANSTGGAARAVEPDQPSRIRELEHLSTIRELEGTNAELTEYTTQLEALRPRLRALEASNVDLSDGIAEMEAANRELIANNAELGRRVAGIARLDINGMRHRIEKLETENRDLLARVGEATARIHENHSEPPTTPGLDLQAAVSILGKRTKLDDLKMVEGIGPQIAKLCHESGILTWQQLSETNPDALRGMLSEAGPRFRTHDPALWPRQAGLLAQGKWEDFRDLKATIRSLRSG